MAAGTAFAIAYEVRSRRLYLISEDGHAYFTVRHQQSDT
jgi:hypothetical protein